MPRGPLGVPGGKTTLDGDEVPPFRGQFNTPIWSNILIRIRGGLNLRFNDEGALTSACTLDDVTYSMFGKPLTKRGTAVSKP